MTNDSDFDFDLETAEHNPADLRELNPSGFTLILSPNRYRNRYRVRLFIVSNGKADGL